MFEKQVCLHLRAVLLDPCAQRRPDRHAGNAAWNETLKTSSKSRLMRDGRREDAPKFGLSESQILTIERLAIEPEAMLGSARISDQFDPDFFKTDFWLMWCTTFAFQPWHSAVEFKRYLVRFAHMVGGFNRLQGIMRTVYNQYDSLVRPLRKWLDERGVVFEMNTRVTNLVMLDSGRRQDGRSDRLSARRPQRAHRGPSDRPRLRDARVDDGRLEPRLDGCGAVGQEQGRRRGMDPLGDNRGRAAGIREARRLLRPYRPVEMDLLHHDDA